jgi:glycosyltransferase involved in cell wall biosynthesis
LTTIAVCVLARDEQANLADLLPTLSWADETLVLVDDATTDDSAIVAEACADRVELHRFVSFSEFRNAALQQARSEWVFFVDADERVSPALAAEARAVVSGSVSVEPTSDAPAGYWVPRLNIMFGRLIRGGGWYPDEQLRLLRRDAASYDEGVLVHEHAEVRGRTGHLAEPLLHLNYRSPRHFANKQRQYTALEARELVRQGGRPRARSLIGAPLREFIRRFITLRGWIDGPMGLVLSLAMAYYAFQRVRLARRLGS